jgi:hypothetical protein
MQPGGPQLVLVLTAMIPLTQTPAHEAATGGVAAFATPLNKLQVAASRQQTAATQVLLLLPLMLLTSLGSPISPANSWMARAVALGLELVVVMTAALACRPSKKLPAVSPLQLRRVFVAIAHQQLLGLRAPIA